MDNFCSNSMRVIAEESSSRKIHRFIENHEDGIKALYEIIRKSAMKGEFNVTIPESFWLNNNGFVSTDVGMIVQMLNNKDFKTHRTGNHIIISWE